MKTKSPKCPYCDTEGTQIHAFLHCDSVQYFWRDVEKINGKNFRIDNLGDPDLDDDANPILQLSKIHIYR